MVYYINKLIRIREDAYNFMPEILNIKKDKDGVQTNFWKTLGYCCTLSQAINLIIRETPANVLENKGVSVTTLTEFIKILETLSKNIKVEILNQIKEEEEKKG